MNAEHYSKRLSALQSKVMIDMKRKADVALVVNRLKGEANQLEEDMLKIDRNIRQSLDVMNASDRFLSATEQQSIWRYLDLLEEKKSAFKDAYKRTQDALETKNTELNTLQLLLNKTEELLESTQADLNKVWIHQEEKEMQDLFLTRGVRG